MNVRPDRERSRHETFLLDNDRRVIRRGLGSGATPLTTTGHPEVARRQEKVQRRLQKRITGSLIDHSPLIRAFAEQNFLGRFARRLDRNRASYDTRLVADIPDEMRDTHDRVLIGDGSAKDALIVMSGLGMRSIELARLTHPNRDMHDNPQLDDMRADVHDAVTMLGGVLHEDVETAYELSNIDTIVPSGQETEDGRPIENAAVRDGMMVTAKRHIATMPDGTRVLQRTSYIIDLNELPPEISEVIRSVNTLETKDSLRVISDLAQLDELLPYLIELGADEEGVIPISTTIYAYNELVAQLITELADTAKDDSLSEDMRRIYAAREDDEARQSVMQKRAEEHQRLKRLSRGIGKGTLHVYELPYDDSRE